MANRNDKDTTGRTVAIVGGGALLLLLLLRGKGWGFGGDGGDDQDDGHGAGVASTSNTTGTPTLPPCRVRIDADGIQLDGVPSDLATVTERCRAAGAAEIRATGAAITGVIAEVVQTLQAAGVKVRAAPDVWNAAVVTPARRPQ